MSNPNSEMQEKTGIIYTNIMYYDSSPSNMEDFFMNLCQHVDGKDSELIIEDNTIYEIDCECFNSLQRKKNKRNGNS